MQSKEAPPAQTSTAVYPSGAEGEGVDHQEVSHVFHCMQCDLHFQMDMAVTSRKGSHEIDAGVIRVRLDPCIKLEQEA
jgi:hypothetical protein